MLVFDEKTFRRCFVSNETSLYTKMLRFRREPGRIRKCFDVNKKREGVFRLRLKNLPAFVSSTAKQFIHEAKGKMVLQDIYK
jgi:hypothetical protein